MNVRYYQTFGGQKCHFHKLLKICLTFSIFAEIMITLQSPMQNWLKHWSTNMVVATCMLSIQKCMIHHINQNFSADAKMYHTFVYVEHTWSYGHISTQFWRSVSASGHAHPAGPSSISGTPTGIYVYYNIILCNDKQRRAFVIKMKLQGVRNGTWGG